ncbi:MAG: endolytic transglycosylase MltG [Limnohabitans sp.]
MKSLFKALGVLLLLLGAAAAAAYFWLHQPMGARMADAPADAVFDLSIEPGTSPKTMAQMAVEAGADVHPMALYAWFRLSGQSRQMRAGSYEFSAQTTPIRLLAMLVRGEESLRTLTLVEGWNIRQLRQALARADQLKPDSQTLDDEALMAQLGRPGVHPEGRFFPDTYSYAKGASDLAVLKRAMKAMDKQLDKVWQVRSPRTAVRSPEEALILASIVEKETGKAQDRPQISGVFNNRLRIGMLLQTDPTVIYGLGASFDGNLRRRDLHTDTPYNTYTRAGLPPTPIAMPGKASLLAAVQPADTRAVYFVAKGDGSSHFSATLDEHNRAVWRYQKMPAQAKR